MKHLHTSETPTYSFKLVSAEIGNYRDYLHFTSVYCRKLWVRSGSEKSGNRERSELVIRDHRHITANEVQKNSNRWIRIGKELRPEIVVASFMGEEVEKETKGIG